MDEELLNGIVFRLAPIKNTFPPDASRPQVSHFDLSNEDKQRAKETGRPALLSVFDQKTRVAEAQALMANRHSIPFGLKVETVRAITVSGMYQPLRVVRDPLPRPYCDRPGADGHCGIDGLHRAPEHSRQIYREIKALLVDASFPYDDATT